MKRLSTLIALLMIRVASSCYAAGYAPVVGTVHPDFVLPRIDTREAVSLSQYRGQKVLLIHFASW